MAVILSFLPPSYLYSSVRQYASEILATVDATPGVWVYFMGWKHDLDVRAIFMGRAIFVGCDEWP